MSNNWPDQWVRMEPAFMRASVRIQGPGFENALIHYKQKELLARFGVYQLYKAQRKRARGRS
jgi:hypothetical protein